MEQLQFQLMIEADAAEKDYIAYIPALRLGVKGETVEEVRQNAVDLIMMELETRLREGKGIPTNSATMEIINIPMPMKI